MMNDGYSAGFARRAAWRATLALAAALALVSLGLVSCARPTGVPESGASSAATGTAAPAATAAPGSTDAAPNTAEPSASMATAVPTALGATLAPSPTQAMPTVIPSPAPPTEAPLSTATAAPTEPAPASSLPPTPDCAVGMELTAAQTEGPYYTPNAPERASLLEPGVVGERLIVTGYVLDQDCKPIAGALLDFWQADGEGVYDNEGYRLRGRQYTDAEGRYRLETVIPGEYPGRTEHIHVKAQAPGGRALTTQLYFPGELTNQRDGIYDPTLLMEVRDSAEGKVGTFHFVLDAR